MTVRLARAADEAVVLALGRLLTDDMAPLLPEPTRPPLAALYESEAQGIRRTWEPGGEGEQGRQFLLLAEEGGEAVGYALVKLTPSAGDGAPDAAHLNSLFVKAGHRGRGIGRTLLEGAMAEARDRGAACLTLNVLAGNERAEALYRAAGFAEAKKSLWRTL